MKNFGQCKQRELDHNFHYKIFLFELAHGTAHNILNLNVIFTSPVRGENLTDKDERFESYTGPSDLTAQGHYLSHALFQIVICSA